MPSAVKSLSYAYFLICAVVMVVYLTRTTPLFSLGGNVAYLLLALPFVGGVLLKTIVEPLFVDRAPVLLRPKRQFMFDMATYLLIASGLFIIQHLGYMVPANDSFKIIIAALIIGYFASIDNALTRERHWFTENDHETNKEFAFSSLTSRMSLFLTLTVFIAMAATASVAFIDLKGLVEASAEKREEVIQLFALDLFFVFCVVLILTMRLIYSYSLNVQHIFNMQLNILRGVEKGNFEQYVPILTSDEFGLLARQINTMIDGLRDKERLRFTLEKIVSPSIMEKLLTTDDKTLKHGQECDVAILFCDMREFTRFTENASAEDVIFFLNAYFSQMSNIVSMHGGIINKFMGDAILAVYGLEQEDENATENAINTAMAIIEHARKIDLPDGTSLGTGIGIHTGRVVAGTIGSEDRYEYTFIGDAVNTASRLDGLSKRLGYGLIISEDAYKLLPAETRLEFVDLGEHDVRGKAEQVHVYGAVRQPVEH